MSSRLRGPPRGGVDPEAVFHTNLLLLGYRDATPPGATSIPVTPSMFDHANPVAFQQVFHFLFRTLDSETARIEFRDCWPILDRKQEAEFRRKIVSWLKDLQKDFPQDVPYTNPSLFQSPGGRKFVSFLATFSSFVLKRCVEMQKTKLASKTASKNSVLRETYLRGLITMETSSLQTSVNNQGKSRKIYQKSVSSVNEISEKYLEMKTMLNEVSKTEDRLRDSIQTVHESETKEPNCDLDVIMSHCSREYDEVNKLREDFEKFFSDHCRDWNGIISAMDDSLAKPKLNLSQYPPETMVGEHLKTIYENLLIKSLELAKKLTANNATHFPSKAKRLSEGVSRQATCLRELKQSLEGTVPEMVANVTEMQADCAHIDWSCSSLAPKDKNGTPPKLLLPPTPNLVLGNKISTDSGSPALSSRLKLVSPHVASSKTAPHLDISKPEVGSRQPEADLRLPETPTSGPLVSRRFNKKLVSSHSPLLRTSLIQSTLRRVVPGDAADTPHRKCDAADTPHRKCDAADTPHRKCDAPDTPHRKCDTADTPHRKCDTADTPHRKCDAADTPHRKCDAADTPHRKCDASLREDDTSCRGADTTSQGTTTPVSRFKVSKDSMETFSPVLSSTKSPLITASIQEKEEVSRIDLNETESKIEMYKKFLKSVKKSQNVRPISPAADSVSQRSPSLLDVWTSHKESLSPGSYRSTISETATPKSNPRILQSQFMDRVSPLFQSNSICDGNPAQDEINGKAGLKGLAGNIGLDAPSRSFRLSVPSSESLLESPQGSEDMDSLVVTRLDQLMNSFSLTGDNNLDLSLGRMSLGDLGDQLLSPHCPYPSYILTDMIFLYQSHSYLDNKKNYIFQCLDQ